VNPEQGFTLIEILVVLLIVTVLAGITVPSLPGFVDTADYDLEARRLELLLNMARSEAVLDSAEFGFDLTDGGYEFLRYDESAQRWRRQDSPYQARRLLNGLKLDLRVSNQGFNLRGESLPTVLILSSGETTPVTMTLESDGEYRQIRESW
jgi:general secretion pathway protein H